MDTATRTTLLAAAVAAVGPACNFTRTQVDAQGVSHPVPDPAGWNAAVTEQAIALTVMASEGSKFAQSLDDIANSAPFRATIAAVEKEQRSTRGFLILHTGTEREAKDMNGTVLPIGYEVIRTDRTDSAFGRAVAIKARSLIGHSVLLYRINEPIVGNANGHSVRVAKHIEDLGVDAEATAKINNLSAHAGR